MNQKKCGIFIANQRKTKKLTQQNLAEKLGVSINAVSKWERGLCFPDVSLYKDLCKELDISIEELINGEKGNSDDDKNKAIISTIKSKNKIKTKLKYTIIISFLLISLFISACIIIYKHGKDDINDYYERNYQMTFIGRDIEAMMKYRYDGAYPDYYGGMYISEDAYNMILLIVKKNIPKKGERNYFYYNELITLNDKIKIKYVNNSYNELESVNNKIIDYINNNNTNDNISNIINGLGIDIMKNKVVVSVSKIEKDFRKEFQDKVINSDIVVFEETINNKVYTKCTHYHKEIGDDILKKSNGLISINTGNKDYVPTELILYDDGTYELYTAFETCSSGFCSAMLKYVKSIKGTYNMDVNNLLNMSTNANDKQYSMENLPEYEITLLSEELIKKYDTLSFTVEKGKSNKYLNELLKELNIDLTECAKPYYK